MSARRVWRYPLEIADRVGVTMPRGARLLAVGPPRRPVGTLGLDDVRLDLWTLVDPDASHVRRELLIVGTGNAVPANAAYVGTTHSHGGELIWHVFESAS